MKFFQGLILVALVSGFAACKKNQLGGSSTVGGYVMHHGRNISYARVFIKFEASEFPGKDTAVYDHTVLCAEDGRFSFTCYKGSYYLYGYGFDDAINKEVSGGLNFKVRSHEIKELEVAVTED